MLNHECFHFNLCGSKLSFSHDEIVFWNHRIIDDVVQGLTWHVLGSIWPQEGIPLVVYKQGRSRGFWYLGSRRWQMSIGLTRHQSLELLLDQWEMHRNLKIVMSIDPFRTRTDWNRMDNEQLSMNQLCFKSILYFPGSWRTSGYSLREACKRPDDDEDVWPRQPGALQWRLQEGGREVHLPRAHRQSLGRDPAGDGNSSQGLFSAFLTPSSPPWPGSLHGGILLPVREDTEATPSGKFENIQFDLFLSHPTTHSEVLLLETCHNTQHTVQAPQH